MLVDNFCCNLSDVDFMHNHSWITRHAAINCNQLTDFFFVIFIIFLFYGLYIFSYWLVV